MMRSKTVLAMRMVVVRTANKNCINAVKAGQAGLIGGVWGCQDSQYDRRDMVSARLSVDAHCILRIRSVSPHMMCPRTQCAGGSLSCGC